ncbi:MAG: Wadjet anti-phage system protein JetD domain-containing protein [Spirochaetota bacterium]
MINPGQIKGKASRRYTDYLRSVIQGSSIFPLDLTFAKTKPGEAARRWTELGTELDELRRHSTETRPGKSYTLEWEERRDRLAGAQNLPSRIYFQDEGAYLAFLGKTSEAARFRLDAAAIQAAFPVLKAWLTSRPQRVLDHCGSWQPLLAALRWLIDNPASSLYLREVPAVEDTKFIERHKPILRELLDKLSPELSATPTPEAPETSTASKRLSFEERCGLKTPAPLIRLRILDQSIARLRFSGLVDLALPADSLAALDLPEIQTVLVIENKASFGNVEVFLTVPAMEGCLAIFGSGYAVAALGSAPWLATRRILYWGDIDSHGLRILAGFRRNFPGARSVMMDRETFAHYEVYHSHAPADMAAEPRGLTLDELHLFKELVSSRSGNRLEQERIPLAYAREQLRKSLEGSH